MEILMDRMGYLPVIKIIMALMEILPSILAAFIPQQQLYIPMLKTSTGIIHSMKQKNTFNTRLILNVLMHPKCKLTATT